MENTKTIITWDEYFMGIAILSSLRSKDPSTQVGACIVDKDNKVVSIGYNGMPRHIHDEDLTWNKVLLKTALYTLHYSLVMNAQKQSFK